ncbi:hypothetical protein DUI87_04620 [Hirundo rustica rustica]|uniref:Sema domain-containing protein n=1 Tax=Hirundo rustica rustica TaxID=333673 RepID=A0A3M0L4B6_HIRRU|nr:hypothetical protein DUI87_04620 [Hirundo rustica rustica]
MELFNGEVAKEKVLLVLDDATLSDVASPASLSNREWGVGRENERVTEWRYYTGGLMLFFEEMGEMRDLKPWVSNFTYPGVRDFSQLALDANRNQLIVGARNYLFRLSLHNVSLIQATAWGSDEDTRRSCQSKGKTEEECQNYVRVLIVYGKKVFTCGTNAFSPVCSSRQVGNLSKIIDRINGVARCPYDPRHNSTAVITSRGELYAATVIDFSGRDPAIYRSLGNVPPLRTAQYNSKWLNEPNFIAAYDIGLFTYFFFRENAVEHDCGKTVYSRVARVCKNDIGGRFLLEDTWTTFMKARLNCSRAGEIPFYYNELQSTFYLPEQDLIYGVFTTNVNSIAASAVCAFNLSAITQAFNGPFRYQENPRSAWLPTLNPIPNFQCGTLNDDSPNENLTERVLQDAQRLFLMNDVVQPVTVDPYVTQDSIRFSKLVVDIVQGKDTLYHVMYIGTEYGTILKALSTTNRSLRSCYLEEMQILPDGQQEAIKSLQILHSDRSLFVGLNNGVLKIPLERCSMYRTEGFVIEISNTQPQGNSEVQEIGPPDGLVGCDEGGQNLLNLGAEHFVFLYTALVAKINIDCTPRSGGTCERWYALPKQGPDPQIAL